jgi:hypothetical protein
MGWLDPFRAVLGGRQPLGRLAREESHRQDPQLPDNVHEKPCAGAAPREPRREAVTPTVQRRAPLGHPGGSLLGRLASRCLRPLRGGGDLGVWHPGVLYVIVHPRLTRGQIQRRLTLLLHGMQQTFPGHPLKVIAYNSRGDQLVRLTWAPQMQEASASWRCPLPD